MSFEPGSIIGTKYRLERHLSKGGMGSVWLARHVHLGSPVAIKFMDPAYAASHEFVARFEREARIAATLQSPHVVHVQDYGIEAGNPYLVMELLQGEDLGERLNRVGRLSLPEAVRILSQAGRAVRRAHEAGLVHRDLKPGNLFLARVEDEEVVKVLDFGIVKESGGQLMGEVTRTGQVLGSPHYMSPEQVKGEKDLDHRSDLWSMGVILFRMVTGQLPFPGDQLGAVMAKILMEPLPRATALAPDLPAEIEEFFAKALARDRGQRFQSVREMIDELSRLAAQASQSPQAAPARAAMASWTGEGEALAKTEVLPDGLNAGGPGVEVASPAAAATTTTPLPAAPLPAAPLPASTTPAADSGGAALARSASTLTGANVGDTGISSTKAPRRTPTLVAIGAALLVLGGGAVIYRLGSAPAGGGPAADPAPSSAPEAAPPPTPTLLPTPAPSPEAAASASAGAAAAATATVTATDTVTDTATDTGTTTATATAAARAAPTTGKPKPTAAGREPDPYGATTPPQPTTTKKGPWF